MQTQIQKAVDTSPQIAFSTLKSGAKLAVANIDSSRKAAISVSIDKGHFSAIGYPEGFAHLLEHMLFNASKLYPQSNAFDDYLHQHHGQANAWTQDTHMCYQFTCDPSGVLEACNILFDRLTQPLFTGEDIEKEIATIDAEFQLKIDDPVSRLLAVQKAICNQAHPFARFSTGSKQTFGQYSSSQIKTMLQAFHEYLMQGQHMCICIVLPQHSLSNIDVDKLIQSVEHALDNTRNELHGRKKQENSQIKESPSMFLPENMNRMVHIKQNHQHQLMKSFILYNVNEQTADSLLVLLTHLSQSKHQQGLYDVLVKQNWINNLHCYYKHLEQNTYELCLSVELNNNGAQNYKSVCVCIAAFFDFVRSQGIEKWRLREKALQFNLQADLHSQTSALEFALNLTHKMHTHAFEDCLLEDTFYIDETHVELPSVLKQLTRSQTQLYFMSPLAQCDSIAPHYEVEYALSNISINNSTEHRLVFNFALPRVNPFMVRQNKLIQPEIDKHDVFSLQSEQLSLKFYQDTQFQLANGECYISITDPLMYNTSQQIAIKRVWLACLNEYLAARFFDVEYASLHFRVYPHHHGISIHTSGLSEKQLLLCIELINTVKAFKATEAMVSKHLHKCIARIRSNTQQKPFNQLFSCLNEYYSDDYKSNLAVLQSLQSLSYKDVDECQHRYFAHNYVESLLIGNWQTGAVKRLFNQINSRFNALESLSKPNTTSTELKQGEHIHVHIHKFKNENIIWHIIPTLQSDDEKLALAARSLILEKLLAPIAFNILRQQHQMGYMLGVGYKPIGVFPGVALYLQSPSHSVVDIFSAMQKVIETALNLVQEQADLLEHLVKELCKQVTPKEKSLDQRANRAWLHFEDENPLLAYKDLIQALQQVRLGDLHQCLCNMLLTSKGQTLLTQNGHSLSTVIDNEAFAQFFKKTESTQ